MATYFYILSFNSSNYIILRFKHIIYLKKQF